MGIAVKWDFTSKCNLRCIHCSAGGTHFSPDVRKISLKDKLTIVDKLAAANVRGITFLGGEPLTAKDVFPVLSYAASLGIAVTVITNGTLLDDSRIDKILRAGVSTVGISIDGASSITHDKMRGKGSFDKTITNVSRLILRAREDGHRLLTKVNTVINRINRWEIDEMFELGRKLGVNELSFLALSEIGRAVDHKAELVLTPKETIEAAISIGRKYAAIQKDRYPDIKQQVANPLVCDYLRQRYEIEMPGSYVSTICCLGGISLGYVTPDGYLFPCDRIVADNYVGQKIRGATVERGSLLTDSFDEIWESAYFAKMFELIMDDDTYSYYEPCRDCNYLKMRLCNPCPLDSRTGSAVVGPCLIAAEFFERNQIVTAGEDKLSNNNILSGFTTYTFERAVSTDSYLDIEQRTPVKSEGIRQFDKKDGSSIIFNPRKPELCRLELLSKFMWDLVDGKNKVCDIYEQVEEVIRSVRESLRLEDSGYYSSSAAKGRIAAYFKDLSEAGFVELRDEDDQHANAHALGDREANWRDATTAS